MFLKTAIAVPPMSELVVENLVDEGEGAEDEDEADSRPEEVRNQGSENSTDYPAEGSNHHVCQNSISILEHSIDLFVSVHIVIYIFPSKLSIVFVGNFVKFSVYNMKGGPLATVSSPQRGQL